MLVFDISYNAVAREREDSDQEAIDYARGIVWSEICTTEQEIKYAAHVGEYDGVQIWYDYGADYYFYTDGN